MLTAMAFATIAACRSAVVQAMLRDRRPSRENTGDRPMGLEIREAGPKMEPVMGHNPAHEMDRGTVRGPIIQTEASHGARASVVAVAAADPD